MTRRLLASVLLSIVLCCPLLDGCGNLPPATPPALLDQTQFVTGSPVPARPSTTELLGPYLGQTRPGQEPLPFLPEIFGVEGRYGYNLHSSLYFSPDGQAVLFTHQALDSQLLTVYTLEQENGVWSEPHVASFSGSYSDNCAAFSADGSRFYWTSNRPTRDGDSAQSESSIWYVERIGGDWSEAVPIGSVMQLDRDEGTVYFGAVLDGGFGGADIYAARFVAGRYGEPENIGQPVNTGADEYAVLTASDESYIVIYRSDPGDRGVSGLWLSERLPGGVWSDAIDLDTRLGLDTGFDASLSPDGTYLFVLDRGVGVFWIEASTLAR